MALRRLQKRDLRVPFFVMAALLLGGCGGGSGDDDDDDGPEPFKLVLDAPPFMVTEETPSDFHVLVLASDGQQTTFSGEVAIEAENGPISPATFTASNGEATIPVTLELGGDNFLTFSSGSLVPASTSVFAAPRVPAKIDGSLSGGSVFAGGGPWDTDGAWSPSVLFEDGKYLLYYASSDAGGPVHIGLAVSTDGGLTFFGRPTPLVGPSVAASACHTDGADAPNVHRDGASLVMVYAGESGGVTALCQATSADGTTWTVDPAPVLAVSTSAETFDNVALRGAAVVSLEGGGKQALYAAEGSGDFSPLHAGLETIGALGLASADATPWMRVPGNRAFGSIEIGALELPDNFEWDTYSIGGPAIQRDGPVFRVWATGLGTGMVYRIGRYAALDLAALGAHLESSGDATEVIGVSAGRFDADGALSPSVVEDASGLRSVYYTGLGGDGVRRIGLARF